MTLTIGIVAGEISGDHLGASLIKKIQSLHPSARFIGVGGEKMQVLGLKNIVPQSTLAVMGLTEIVAHLPKLLLAKRKIMRALARAKIDIFIGIDSPEFNLRLAKTLKTQGVFCVQYVSPSLWAWRPWRVHGVIEATNLVLCLFDFEPALYHAHGGQAVFVGHPLFSLAPSELPIGDLRLCVMAGSRTSEIHAMLDDMLAATKLLAQKIPRLSLIIPIAHDDLRTLIGQKIGASGIDIPITLEFDGKQALKNAHFALIASGTATLEAMVLARPMVVVYKQSPITYKIARTLLTTPFVALPNILARHNLVPELLQDCANPSAIADTLLAISKHLHSTHAALLQARAKASIGANCPADAILSAYFKRSL